MCDFVLPLHVHVSAASNFVCTEGKRRMALLASRTIARLIFFETVEPGLYTGNEVMLTGDNNADAVVGKSQ